MNKSDVDTIAQALVFSNGGEDLETRLLAMDPRIPDEVELYKEVAGQDEATEERYYELLIEEYGKRYLWKRTDPRRMKQLWKQAHKEVRAQ